MSGEQNLFMEGLLSSIFTVLCCNILQFCITLLYDKFEFDALRADSILYV